MNRVRGEDAHCAKRRRKELTPHGHAEGVVYGYATRALLMTVLLDGIPECKIYHSHLFTMLETSLYLYIVSFYILTYYACIAATIHF